MKNKEYIMVGAPIITKEIFRKVLIPLDNYSYKPSGGFWSSLYIGNTGISDWFSYLQDARSIARYKDINNSTIFTLKEEAKILTVNNHKQILELARKYPSYHHQLGCHEEITLSNTIFDFIKLSGDYDGIYINYNMIVNENKTSVFNKFSVNSLLLFNLDCIKEYRTAPIIYDIDYPYRFPEIIPHTIGESNKLDEESHEHKILTKITQDIFLNTLNPSVNRTFKDYDEYLSSLIITVKIVMQLIGKNERQRIVEIKKYLHSKGIHMKEEHIIQNIVLNYFSEYLFNNYDLIKTLPKSKIKTTKRYQIY